MPQNDIDYRQVRREVEAQIKKQKLTARATFAGVSALLFIILSIIAFIMVASSGMAVTSSLEGALVLLWVSGLLSTIFQIVSLALETKAAEDSMRQQLVARVIGAQLLKLGDEPGEASEKRKHTYALSDDGELEVVETPDASAEDATDAAIKRAMRR